MGDRPEVVVIGGGTSGSVAARRLADAGRRVLLIEAGAGGPEVDAAFARSGAAPLPHLWGLSAGAPALGHSLGIPAVRALGGTSQIYGGVTLRPVRGDLDRWHEATGTQIDWDAAFARVLDVDGRSESLAALPVESPRDALHLPLHYALRAAAAEQLPLVEDLGHGVARGVGWLPLARVHGRRVTAKSAFLDSAPAQLVVRTGTTVRRIVVSSGAIRGIEVTSAERQEFVPCDEVMLCAGAVGSPALLLRSGIGDSARMPLGTPVVLPLSGVGRNVRDHIGVWLGFDLPSPPVPRTASDSWFHVAARDCADGRAQATDHVIEAFHDFRSRRPGAWASRGILACTLLSPGGAEPRAGVVDVSAAAPLLQFDYTEADMDVLSAVVGNATRLLSHEAFAALGASGLRLIGTRRRTVTAELTPTTEPGRTAITDALRSSYHLHGGCAMGMDPRDGAVTDSTFRVHGVNGLRIGDLSVAPVALRANTHLMAMAIADAAARSMLSHERTLA